MVVADLGKSKGRVDFTPGEFDRLIRDKGLRAQWSRALRCPCRNNAQTDQADPNCVSCGGDGFFYVKPRGAVDVLEYADIGHVDATDAKATQIIVQSMTRDTQIFEKLGEWIFGTVRINCFAFHRFGYRDRFKLEGGCIGYEQTLPMPASGNLVVGPRYHDRDLRYPVVNLLEVYTNTDPTTASVDIFDTVTCNADGSLTIAGAAAPPVDTLLAIKYEINPVLIVLDHVYVLRDSPIALKTSNPIGTEEALPRHAMARLDFLPSP